MVQTLDGNWALWLVPLFILCVLIMIPTVRHELGLSGKKKKQKEDKKPGVNEEQIKPETEEAADNEIDEVLVLAAAAYIQTANKYGGNGMRNLKITVNGKTYSVSVEEENQSGYTPRYSAPASATSTARPAAEASKAAAPAEAPVVKAAAGSGENSVAAPMSGKIVEIVAPVGTAVKAGDTLVVMEAMKLQSEVCSDFDGVVKSVNVKEGQMVTTGEVIAVIG